MGVPELILKDTRVKLSTPEKYDLGSAPWMRLVDDTCDIVQIVIDTRSFGVSGIKMYSHLSKNVVYKLAQEAHRQGLQVWSHSFVGPATVADVVNADVDAISRVPALLYRDDWNLKKDGSLAMDGSILGSDRLDRILDMMKRNGILLDPTLAIFEENLKRVTNSTERTELEELLFAVTALAHNGGVSIVTGTDIPISAADDEFPHLYHEIELLVTRVGLTPMEAITAATKNGAIVLGIDKTHGTIEIGKVANVVVLQADPTEDIRNISRVEFVIKNGIILGASDNILH